MFLAASREYILYNVEKVKVRKMSEIPRSKLYCKMSDLVGFVTF